MAKIPFDSLPAGVCGAFWWQSSKAEPCSAFLAVRFPLSLVLANFVILDALAFTR